MTKLGRSNLNGQVQSNLPTNNAKLITAAKHRSVLADYSDSKFNLEDDSAFQVKFDNNGTDLKATTVGDAIIELNTRIRPFLGGGTIRIGDMGSESVGSRKTVLDGTFNSCSVVENILGGRLYEVTMPDVGTSNYYVFIQLKTVGTNNSGIGDSLTITDAIVSKTSNSFRFGLNERGRAVQNMDLEILLIKKF